MSRGQFLSLLIFLYLVGSPIIAGYVVVSAQGISKSTIISYNSNNFKYAYAVVVNSTNSYNVLQDTIFDNSTLVITIASMNLTSPISNPYRYVIDLMYNFTDIQTLTETYKIEVYIDYIGTGNITDVNIIIGDGIQYLVGLTNQYMVYSSNYDIKENDTIIIYPETFESLKFADKPIWDVEVWFNDENNLPSQDDYIQISLILYKKDTVISKDTMISWVVGGLAFCNVMIAFASTKYWNPMQHGRKRSAYRIGFKRGIKYILRKLRRRPKRRFWRRRRRY